MTKPTRLKEILDKNIVLEGFDPVSSQGFTQVPNCILKQNTISSNAKVVYALLLSYAWYNDYCFPGQDRLERESGMSQATISRSISELREAGLLEVERRGQGKTNIYTLHARAQRSPSSQGSP